MNAIRFKQWQIIENHNQKDPLFNIKELIKAIVFSQNEKYVIFNDTIFTSRLNDKIYGRIRQEDEGIRFTLDRSIVDTPEARYTYALLLAVYMEFIQYEHRSNIVVYVTSDWEAISADIDLVSRGAQGRIIDLARSILINDDLFDDNFSVKVLADRFQVPKRVILEKLEEYEPS